MTEEKDLYPSKNASAHSEQLTTAKVSSSNWANELEELNRLMIQRAVRKFDGDELYFESA